MKQEKTLLDFHQDWIKLIDKGFADYNSLTKEERVWFNIQGLIQDVDNGGLISHYCNSGADKNKETIEDLVYLGKKDVADILEKINKLFPEEQPTNDIDERNEIISNWPERKYDDFLEQQDKEFYENEKDLELKLIEHIIKGGLSK